MSKKQVKKAPQNVEKNEFPTTGVAGETLLTNGPAAQAITEMIPDANNEAAATAEKEAVPMTLESLKRLKGVQIPGGPYIPKGVIFLNAVNFSGDQMQAIIAAPPQRGKDESYEDYQVRRKLATWITQYRNILPEYVKVLAKQNALYDEANSKRVWSKSNKKVTA